MSRDRGSIQFMGGAPCSGRSTQAPGSGQSRDTTPSTQDRTAPSHLGEIALTLHGIHEEQPGLRWQALFRAVWPAYRAWYLADGESARPHLGTCRDRLERHMPELIPTWRRLVELTGHDELAARMLTLWDPPAFLPGCSQVVMSRPAPMLLRNYDYDPTLFEQVAYSTNYRGRKVLGTSDCLWGLLDGMNDDGLAVSLAFGGRPGSAPGFAITLVLRYLLEVATSTDQAKSLLCGLPVSMAYNLTMVDRQGATATAFVAPGQDPEFSDLKVATNHRGRHLEDPSRPGALRSRQRQELVLQHLVDGISTRELADRFLLPPLFQSEYSRSDGTLYTALYEPSLGTVEYLWPGDSWQRSFSSGEDTKTVILRSVR